MIEYIIPLLHAWIPLFVNYLLPIFALAFVVWVKDFLIYFLSEG